ncbi:WGR domain [Pseudocohnilembus persalinus]|uniref:Poly [ADP-ribose] polymerase n=1 Tax=Pseudocohnilembus persalinus TaxID=266149 RepID=A0A0V0QWU2_PSEPJ|nr:WGR domain [Pseudocohnilembus persalinus]|eukprot:KRX06678.1 WGR domain [Pseudocohnilembus persalinus]
MPPKRKNPVRNSSVEKTTKVTKTTTRSVQKKVEKKVQPKPTTKKTTSKATQKALAAQKATTKATTKATPKASKTSKATTKAETKKKASEKASKTQQTKQTKQTKQSEQTTEIVKVITKGGAAVDQYVQNKDNFRVYAANSTTYSTTMNKSDLNNNNNKFYVVQILQNENNGQLFVFNRWGRVGVPGQQVTKGPFNSVMAVSDYSAKVRDKVRGGYTVLDIKYDDEEKEDKKNKNGNGKKVGKVGKKKESKMEKPVQDLINLIFDRKMIDTTMKEIGYDAKKCPLGKLGDNSIKAAYQCLNELSTAISKKKGIQEYNRLSGVFYSHIPHNFGFQKMQAFVIDTDDKVEKKLNMLQSLTDMKIATKILDAGDKDEDDESIVDKNYKSLKNKIEHLPASHKDHKQIMDFIEDSSKNSWSKVKVKDIFTLKREGEDKKYNKKIGNDHYLWHGSRLQNYVGILSQGLRIAPPEAPVNGYAYGKGLYFANAFATSIGYCYNQNTNEKIMLLCKVAVGKTGPLKNRTAKYPIDPKHNCCLGFASKNLSAKAYTTMNGIKMPYRSAKEGQNAYIVYDTAQAQLEYLVRFQ